MNSKYKYVYPTGISLYLRGWEWIGKVNKQSKLFKTELEAARWVDIQLIRLGKKPVNIFKKKIDNENA